MSVISSHTQITPEELVNLSDAKDFELVDGELVKRHVSILSSRIAGIIYRYLDNEAARTKEAKVYPNDLGYQCYPDPGKIRKPDVSVVRSSRLTGIDPDAGYMPIPADLVVEVISPNDLDYAVAEKIREYLAAGFPLIWIVRPNVQNITVYARGLQPMVLESADEITAAPALAEFRCKVSALFE
jgi:Uma2 family endonuclease